VKSGAKSPSRTKRSSLRRAVGVVRVSRVGARSGEQFVSPSEQRTRIEEACARDNLELVDTFEELDVSGGAALAKRPGLRRAVELVEAGEADTVVVAYFDRLVRSLKVQLEVAERVEAAGGKIVALDVGEVGVGATGKLTAQFLGAVAEYHRNVTAERTAEAKRRAIARGVPTFSKIPPGYRQRDDGTLEVRPKEAKTVAEAFRQRAEGATVMETRDYLREHGIERSYHGTQAILTSRMYLGELRFGELVNTASHPAIVDADTWARVQRMRSPRGRRAKSERLLARLGVLRCGTCGARMVVGSSNHSHYWIYRCPPVGDCPQRVTISAEIAEAAVVDAVKELLRDVKGSATISRATEAAERDLETAEAELAAAVEAFTGLEDVAAARQRLLELREKRDKAVDRLDGLQAAQAPAITLTAEEWDELTMDEQRALIRAVIDRADVAPGRGADRITVTPR
jgi:DNA invertase Pin-like site-specific DNA recombinase